jgi:mRNA interferase RelE/StbE
VFTVRYEVEAQDDLKRLRALDRSAVLAVINVHLVNEPTRESRSRIKKTRQPFWCQYRLRIGEFRAYYNVEGECVRVLRVLEKGSGTTPTEEP